MRFLLKLFKERLLFLKAGRKDKGDKDNGKLILKKKERKKPDNA